MMLSGQFNNEQNSKYFIKGLDAFNREDYNRAISNFKKDIKQSPENYQSYYFLGMSLHNKYPFYSTKQSNAIDRFNQYVKFIPEDPRGYLRRGMVYYAQMKYDMALKDFEHCIRLNATIPEAYYFRAITREKNFTAETKESCDLAFHDFKIFFALTDSNHSLNKCANINRCTIKKSCGYYCELSGIRSFCFIPNIEYFDTTSFQIYKMRSVYEILGVFRNYNEPIDSQNKFTYLNLVNSSGLTEITKQEMDSFKIMIITLRTGVYFFFGEVEEFTSEMKEKIKDMQVGERLIFEYYHGTIKNSLVLDLYLDPKRINTKH